ncbi:MAG: hypothetical protein IPO32_05390 [Crocinitomicaceae bacterium]|nr:hypothetical protein [Crocinitomicaceae bacterium]
MKKLLLILVICCNYCSGACYARTNSWWTSRRSPPVGSPPAGGPPCWSPPCIPIDGGIGLLLAAGAFIGVRRIYKGSEDKADTQA